MGCDHLPEQRLARLAAEQAAEDGGHCVIFLRGHDIVKPALIDLVLG
jgi:hypothetical protein